MYALNKNSVSSILLSYLNNHREGAYDPWYSFLELDEDENTRGVAKPQRQTKARQGHDFRTTHKRKNLESV